MGDVTRYTGANAMIAKLKRLQVNAPNIFASALYKEAEVEAKECKRRCPVKTGTLRGTIHVEGPTRDPQDLRKIRCAIVAGGPSADYALYVHEDLEAFHGNGEAKFIERPLQESAPYMAARIAKRIDLNEAL